MATKNTKNLIKRSAVPGKIPTTVDLELGELALNTADGKLFTKKNNGVDIIVEIGAGGGSSTLDGLTDVVITSPVKKEILAYDGTNWINNPNFDILVNGMTVGRGGLNGGHQTNLAFGFNALRDLPTDSGDFTKTYNVAIGEGALQKLTDGQNNLAIGGAALSEATAAGYNIGIGAHALQQITTGQQNIAIGFAAGGGGWESQFLTTGSSNTYIGSSIIPLTANEFGAIVIGAGASSHGTNTVTIGNQNNNGTYLYGTLYVNDTEFTGGGGAEALDDLTDVVITTPANGQVLGYNGTSWVNTTPTGGSGGISNGTISIGGSTDFDFGTFTSPTTAFEIDGGTFV